MLTLVIELPPEVAENLTAPAEFEDKETVMAVVVGLPNASCSCTVAGPSVELLDAVPVSAVEVNTSLLAAPAETEIVALAVMLVWTVSLTVTDLLPAVPIVTENWC